MTLPNSQHQYQLVRQGQGLQPAAARGCADPRPGRARCWVQVRATSLNRRGRQHPQGFLPIANRDTLVPLSMAP